jgi:hypothetical protein
LKQKKNLIFFKNIFKTKKQTKSWSQAQTHRLKNK